MPLPYNKCCNDASRRYRIGYIAGKIAFEALGNVKMLIALLGVLAPLAVAGLALLLGRRPGPLDGDAGAAAGPTALVPAGPFLLGAYGFYTVAAPFHSQGGSFKKAAMTLIPFAAILAAWLIGEVVAAGRARATLMLATCALLAFHALDLGSVPTSPPSGGTRRTGALSGQRWGGTATATERPHHRHDPGPVPVELLRHPGRDGAPR